jgi:hypothetical protein
MEKLHHKMEILHDFIISKIKYTDYFFTNL